MAGVYCVHCFALISDLDTHCKSCRRMNARRRVNPAIGTFLLSVIMGCFCTAIYARVLFLSWPTWEKIFEDKNSIMKSDSYADEAAILVGIFVFVMTGFIAGLSMRPDQSKMIPPRSGHSSTTRAASLKPESLQSRSRVHRSAFGQCRCGGR